LVPTNHGVGNEPAARRVEEATIPKVESMGPLRKQVDRGRFAETETVDVPGGVEADAPDRTEQDWDSIEGAAPDTAIRSGDGDEGDGIEDAVRSGVEASGDLSEEDDDNPDQESDEALPDDEEEHAIRRDMAGQGIRYKPD
jgi:hypothetical protein